MDLHFRKVNNCNGCRWHEASEMDKVSICTECERYLQNFQSLMDKFEKPPPLPDADELMQRISAANPEDQEARVVDTFSEEWGLCPPTEKPPEKRPRRKRNS